MMSTLFIVMVGGQVPLAVKVIEDINELIKFKGS